MATLLALLSIVILLFFLRISDRISKADGITQESFIDASDPATQEEEWHQLSWNGEDPWRVIYLAPLVGENMSDHHFHKHLASSFYSQVKHAMRKGWIPTAIAFLYLSRCWADAALHGRKTIPENDRDPIDLEVIGAPDFLLGSIPIIGRLFGFRKQALLFLLTAEKELVLQQELDPLTASLIWSKLWALTYDEFYRKRIQNIGLTREMHPGQLDRIARHLGLKSREELFRFCNI